MSRRTVRGADPEAGSASVLVAAACALLLVAASGLWLLAGALSARARAAAAADLAALAAADRWTTPESACAVAAEVARLQGAVLSGCGWAWESGVPVVSVTAAPVRVFADDRAGLESAVRQWAVAQARASPDTTGDPG